jgi:hypothetical protein
MPRVNAWSTASIPMAVPFHFMARVRCFTFEPRLLLDPAAGEGGGKKDDDQAKGADYWQKEAKAAFQARDEAKKALTDVATRQSDIEKELKTLRDEKTARDADAQKRSDDDKRKQLESEGKYKEILDQTQNQHQKQLNDIRQAAATRLLRTAIAAAAGQIEKLSPEARADLPFLLRDQVRINPESFEVEVMGDDGKPAQILKENKLQPLPLGEHLQAFVAKRPYMMLDSMQKGAGSKPGAGGEMSKGMTVEEALKDPTRLAAWEKEDPEGYKKAMADYANPSAMMDRAKALHAKP